MEQSRDLGERAKWWREAVIYQIYPRSFADSNGDGVGDLRGIEQRLDYLADTLGVDALWISPFFESPMRDFGYDISNHTDVDPLFGALSDAEDLIRAVHSRDMKVILDYVSNHTSIDHAWFAASRASRDSPERDWYVWRDPAPGGGPPNNWLSVFGGPAWTLDPATGQYYLHSFLSSMPDLNWRHPPLREAMHDVLRFWLDRGVDGFRIDAAHFIGKDPEFRDNPLAPPGSVLMHRPMGAYDSQVHLYDKGDAFAHEVYRDVRALLDEYADDGEDRLLIGEMHLYDWEEWASYFGPNLDEFHLPYNFGMLKAGWDARGIRDIVETIEAVTPPGAWPNWVIGNHDESRAASRLGPAQARAAMTLLLTLRGTPTLYCGDELGMVDAEVPPERRQDPWGLQVTELDVSRDPQRSPMLWTTGVNGGFCPSGVDPWLPAIDPARYSVAAQLDEPGSMLELTRSLLRLRKQRPSLRAGGYAGLDGLPPDCFGFARDHDGERTIVLASFSDDELDVKLDAGGLRLLVSSDGENPTHATAGGGRIRLRPHEAVVLESVGLAAS